jgi:uncharacterized protein YeaC (DUF1315 family)
MIENITPDIYESLKLAVEIGKWSDGRKLTAEQRELSLQAMIAWEIQNLPEDQRTGYMGPQECKSKSTKCRTSCSSRMRSIDRNRSRCSQQDVGATGEPTVQYAFRLGDTEVPVNPLIGTTMRLEYLGAIHCTHCGRKTKTSFSQGYCYPCMTKLAQCDLCIMSPERCHYDAGTCREPGGASSSA